MAAPRVFLSSIREDTFRVRPIYKALKAQGFEVWMDKEDLMPGQQWRPEISRAIQNADIFLSFLSEESEIKQMQRKRAHISYDLEFVLELNEGMKPVIPVRLDAVQLPLPLLKHQSVDFFSPDAFEKLISTIRSALESKADAE